MGSFLWLRPCTAVLSSVFLLSFILGASQQALAATADVSRQTETLLRQAEDRLKQDIESAMPKASDDFGRDTKDFMPKSVTPSTYRKCHHINQIDITSAGNLSREVRTSVSAKYSQKCLGIKEISEILGVISKDYISRGFITSKAYLPKQNLSLGKLEILVVEGTTEALVLEDGGQESIRLSSAFPIKVGELLNLRDLEQGIDQVNRLSSNNAKLNILPGVAKGASRVVITNKMSRPFHARIDTDNQGSESTGKQQVGLTLIADHLLNMNEVLLFTYRQSILNDNALQSSQSTSVNVSIPFGYTTTSFSLSQSAYGLPIDLASGVEAEARGDNTNISLNLERLMYRDQKTRLSIMSNFTIKTSENYFNDQLLVTNSRTLSILKLGSSLSTSFWGNVASVDLAYSRGLGIVGALVDQPDLPDWAPRAQFNMFTLGASFSRPFRWQERNFSLSSALTAQHSLDTLYGSEQISIGGLYSVRGFTDSSLAGDRGYYSRNELSYTPVAKIGQHAIPIKIYSGVDYGKVYSYPEDVPEGALWGAFIGVSSAYKGATAELFITVPLDNKGKDFDDNLTDSFDSESSAFWFRLVYSI
jgi:hemolysin activation/secretion protein